MMKRYDLILCAIRQEDLIIRLYESNDYANELFGERCLVIHLKATTWPFFIGKGFVSPMVGGGEFQLEQFIQVMEFLRVVGQALDQPHRASVAALIDTFAKSSQFIATTFRPELLPYAVRIVGVSYLETQTSRARCVNAEEADEFIRQDSQSLDDTSQSTLS